MKYSKTRARSSSGIFNNLRTIFIIAFFLFIYLLIRYLPANTGIAMIDIGKNEQNNLIKWLGYFVFIISIIIILKS